MPLQELFSVDAKSAKAALSRCHINGKQNVPLNRPSRFHFRASKLRTVHQANPPHRSSYTEICNFYLSQFFRAANIFSLPPSCAAPRTAVFCLALGSRAPLASCTHAKERERANEQKGGARLLFRLPIPPDPVRSAAICPRFPRVGHMSAIMGRKRVRSDNWKGVLRYRGNAELHGPTVRRNCCSPSRSHPPTDAGAGRGRRAFLWRYAGPQKVVCSERDVHAFVQIKRAYRPLKTGRMRLPRWVVP